ncbi:UNVERIFIED_CONTAM: hypothetical protein GTU68_012243, partial [Idotea baltica]|nr:hypothetical protein [Idotea baltica]
MCGIVGYIGKEEALPVLINGLRRLEYRGYDSAGVAILNGSLEIFKSKGKVDNLENLIVQEKPKGNIGIGHTRWATHGEPSNVNAHPQLSQSRIFSVVHNGIIENYDLLKNDLVAKGYTFQSETDTEVLANLI